MARRRARKSSNPFADAIRRGLEESKKAKRRQPGPWADGYVAPEPEPTPPAFTPTPDPPADFKPQRKRAKSKTGRARRRVPKAPKRNPSLPPRRPPKGSPFRTGLPTPATRAFNRERKQATRRLFRANRELPGAVEYTGRNPAAELRELRDQLNLDDDRYGGREGTADDRNLWGILDLVADGGNRDERAAAGRTRKGLAAYGRNLEQAVESGRVDLAEAGPRRSGLDRAKDTLESGLVPEGSALPAIGRLLQGGGRAGVHFLAEDPLEQTLDYGKSVIAGAPAAIGGFVNDPVGTTKDLPASMWEDLVRRWGPAVQGDWETFEETLDEQTALPFLADATIAGGAASKVAGGLAKAGALGRGAERFVTRPRPQRRVGGETRRQRDATEQMAPGLFRVALQRGIDANRGSAQVRRNRRASGRAAQAKARGGDSWAGTRRFSDSAATRRVSKRQLADERARLRKAVARHDGEIIEDKRGRVDRVEFDAKKIEALPDAERRRMDTSFKSAGFVKRRVSGKVVYFAPKEVTPLRAGRVTGGEKRDARKLPAREKGKAIQMLRLDSSEMRREFNKITQRGSFRRGLSEIERQALYYVHVGRVAPDDPDAARAHIDAIIDGIESQRSGRGTGKAAGAIGKALTLSRYQLDELDKLRLLRDRADEVFGPKLRDAANELRELVRRHERDVPGLVNAQRIQARYGPVARDVGVESGARVPVERYDVEASRKSAERRGLSLGLRADPNTEGDFRAGRQRVETTTGDRPERAAEFAHRVREAAQPALVKREREIVGNLDALYKSRKPGKPLTPHLQQRIDEELVNLARLRQGVRGERATPAFAPSEEFHLPQFRIHTAGGAKAPDLPKRRSYALQDYGRQRTDPEVIFQGIQRNIQMGITARLVVDTAARAAHPGTRHGQMTARQLVRFAEREGLDPSEFDLWFPGIYRDNLTGRLVGAEKGRATGRTELLDKELAAAQANDAFVHLNDAIEGGDGIDGALVSGKSIDELRSKATEERFTRQKGLLIPRAVGDEIRASTKQTAAGRAYERIKTMQSRLILGTLNIPWLIADSVVNRVVVAAIGGVTPLAYFKAQAWWRRLPDDLRRELEAEVDIGSQRSQVHKPRLGSTVNNRFVNFFRGVRETPLGQRARPLQHTIDGFLRLEKGLANDPPRRALMYKLLRSEAFRELDADVGRLNGSIHRVADALSLGPTARMQRLIRERDTVEHAAQTLNDVLGDWSTFTLLERMTLGRLFFYPYLRYSTKLMFATLPLNHPARLALIANLSALTNEEQRALLADAYDDQFGTKLQPGDLRDSTMLMLGRFYWRRDDGAIMETNLRNANPLGNVLTESEASDDLLSLLPPVVTMALDQVLKQNTFFGRPWRVKGTADREELRNIGPLDGLMGSERWRILAAEIKDMPWLARELSKFYMPGEHGDDSLPWAQRPTIYKSEDRKKESRQRRKRDERNATDELYRHFSRSALRAFLGKESTVLESIRRRRIAAHEQAGGSSSDGGGGSYPGGSSSGSYPGSSSGSSYPGAP